jgi:hypothetical protein
MVVIKPTLAVAMIVSALAALTACGPKGGSPPPVADGAAPTATAAAAPSDSGLNCGALTAAKASAALGRTVTLVVDTSAGAGSSNCTYANSDGAKARAYVVIGSAASQQFEATRDGTTSPTDVSGVGDKAFDSDQGFGAIQGNHFVSVIGGTPGVPNGQRLLAQAMLTALAGG